MTSDQIKRLQQQRDSVAFEAFRNSNRANKAEIERDEARQLLRLLLERYGEDFAEGHVDMIRAACQQPGDQ